MTGFQFNNSYANLSDAFFSRQAPTPVASPGLIKINHSLAQHLGLSIEYLESPEGVAVLAGNHVPDGAQPISAAYAGHQFGNWVPQLGDGRAVLLGEVLDKNGVPFDIQLKGAGPTPYSRNGDGRSAIGPVVREYIVSEAMAALGVPTTRALAAVTTGESVFRESVLPGAILTRVATSHVRVGTFQFFAARRDTESIKMLVNYVIDRHYPEFATAENKALALLQQATKKQAELVAHWQSIGFIHGVMNTDNASVAGLTIDYGPCAFMDEYDASKVFSSIDHAGRYAYQNQPGIAQWNLANLAQCLLALLDDDEDKALEQAQTVIDGFPGLFMQAYSDRFGAKLGISKKQNDDATLLESLLKLMSESKADFTNTFRSLSHCHMRTDLDSQEYKGFALQFENDASVNNKDLQDWFTQWQQRLQQSNESEEQINSTMQAASPAVIPRNHQIERAIKAAVESDYAPMEKLHMVLAKPFDENKAQVDYTMPPEANEVVTATFCGT